MVEHLPLKQRVEGSSPSGRTRSSNIAGVVELVDTRDLKFRGRKAVRVRFPPPAHTNIRVPCEYMGLFCLCTGVEDARTLFEQKNDAIIYIPEFQSITLV